MPFKQHGLSVQKRKICRSNSTSHSKTISTLSAVLMNLSLFPTDFLAAALRIGLFGRALD